MSLHLLSIPLTRDSDVVTARQQAREIAAGLGFDRHDQARIATAVSEISRTAFGHGGGSVDFSVEGAEAPQLLAVRVRSKGARLATSEPGLSAARRLMDRMDMQTTPEGASVAIMKLFTRRAPVVSEGDASRLQRQLSKAPPRDVLEELQQQNSELLVALDELRRRQEELSQLNKELEDTNRGVVALYAELDEKADHLRRADEIKTRFLSNMTHEFRTPVNSILALSRLLLARSDGDLTEEQAKQVGFIRRGAENLSELVNDLLDLAKVEAGKTVVRPSEFTVGNLFSALRGMLRPLLVNENVNLIFEPAPEGLSMFTDEGKVSQILRNFISNALKFTERGEVRVSAAVEENSQVVVFTVEDTGIGIAPEDQGRIFQEFSQLDHPIQKRVRGTGLGLPLSRRLAELLGGELRVRSEPGAGSAFSARIPIVYARRAPDSVEAGWKLDPGRVPVLVVEDSLEDLLLYGKFLKNTVFQMVPAQTAAEARRAVQTVRPKAIILDILLAAEDTWSLLAEIRQDPQSANVPVLVVSVGPDEQKALSLGAAACARKPLDRSWLLKNLAGVTAPRAARRLLLVDDDEIARYLLRQHLPQQDFVILEATDGEEGFLRAREEKPEAIFLDLIMPGLDGYQTLEKLGSDPSTRDIPVIIVTSRRLRDRELAELRARVRGVITKDVLAEASTSTVIREMLNSSGQGAATGEA